jgi:hypothetical protein
MIIKKRIKILEKQKINNLIIIINIRLLLKLKRILNYLNLIKKVIKYLMKIKIINKFTKNLWLNKKMKVKISLIFNNQ